MGSIVKQAHCPSFANVANSSLTCRQRRIKCDEGKPQCGKCGKSDRKCVYGRPSESSVRHVDEAREAGGSSRPSLSESGDAEHDDDEGPVATAVLPSLLRGSPPPAPTVPNDLAEDQYPIPVDSALQHIPESDLVSETLTRTSFRAACSCSPLRTGICRRRCFGRSRLLARQLNP